MAIDDPGRVADQHIGALLRARKPDGTRKLRNTKVQMPLRPARYRACKSECFRQRVGIRGVAPSMRRSARPTASGVASSARPRFSASSPGSNAPDPGRSRRDLQRPVLAGNLDDDIRTVHVAAAGSTAWRRPERRARSAGAASSPAPSASSQVTRARVTATGCTSRPRTLSAHLDDTRSRPSRGRAGPDQAANGMEQERAGAAGRIEHPLRQRRVHRCAPRYARQASPACSISPRS